MLSHLKSNIAQKQGLSLLLFFIATYCINLLFFRELWVQDEMRYGEVVREMLTTGNWLVPHLNGHPYPDKPALYFWIVCALGSVIGHGETAFRLVSTVATFVAGFGLYQLGSFLDNKNTGFWASVLFGSTLLTLIVGHIVRMDMLLTAITIYAWLAILQFQQTEKTKYVMFFWVLCALSLAIKGPISFLFTLIPGLAWFVQVKGVAGVLKLRPLLGLMFIAALAATWIFAVFQSGQGQYLSTIWHEQLVGRTINSWSHKEPIYFYIVLLPILVMPWAGPILHGFKQLFSSHQILARSIITYTLVPLIGISLVSGKLFIYLEPLIPALCLAGAITLSAQLNNNRVSAWYAWPVALYFSVLTAVVGYLSKLYLNQTSNLGMWVATAVGIIAIVAIFCVKLPLKKWLYAISTLSVMFSLCIFGLYTSLLNPLFSANNLAKSVTQYATNNTPVAVINVTRGILNYYTNRTMDELDFNQANQWVRENPNGIFIIKTSDIDKAFPNKNIPATCQINETHSVELKEYHVLGYCSAE
jgi:4-amino-4-deoxy-L-arabinose transferase-like glycosyltransferase